MELYVGRTDGHTVERGAERVRLAAQEQTRQGMPVRYLRSIFIPEDETWFLLLEAVSADAVRGAIALAALRYERLCLAVETEAKDAPTVVES